jgi:hypothetical protein
MTNEEFSQNRDAIRQEAWDKAAQEKALFSAEKSSINNARNLERRQERESSRNILTSGAINLQEIAKQGGSLGRKLEREIRRFEQTGQVSNWLAGETIKAEAAQNAAQQSAFKQDAVDVVRSMPSDSFDLSPAKPSFDLTTTKPEVSDIAGRGSFHPWKISLFTENQITKYIVALDSFLYKGSFYQNVEVDGLDEEKDVQEGYVVLRGDIANGECSNALIEISNTFQRIVSVFDGTQSNQTKFYYRLGYLFKDENDVWIVRQDTFTNLRLLDFCIDGVAALYPIPS